MIRFVNVTGQIYLDLEEGDSGVEFAYYDTVRDKFIRVCESEVWDSWDEFRKDYDADPQPWPLTRFEGLTPRWVLENPTPNPK